MSQAPAVWSSAKILELDFAGIEQVLMGWCFQNAQYIRLAKLGTHAIVASYALARQHPGSWVPVDLTRSDADIGAYLKTIKKSPDDAIQQVYDQCKRTVHGTAYGLTTFGMVRNFPKIFPSVKVADATQRIYFDLAPEVPEFHTTVRHTAHETHFLGGAATYQYLPADRKVVGHPYGYQHWFWSVVAYERLSESQRIWRLKRGMPLIEIAPGQWYGITLGEDAKRTVSFYPQSMARGVQTETCWPLFDREHPLSDRYFIGDVYYGQTPLRAPIHDSLLLEVPTRKVDLVLERAGLAMQRPIEALPCPVSWGIGPHLTIGVDAKIGPDWGRMEPVAVPAYVDVGVANDTPYSPAEDADEEDVLDLEVRVA